MKKKILYLGLDPTRYAHDGDLIHLPIIEIIPCPFEGKVKEAFLHLNSYTHVILTSRTAVQLYLEYATLSGLPFADKTYIAIGKATALKGSGLKNIVTSQEETAEGIIHLLQTLPHSNTHFFLPRSALARNVIPDFLTQQQICFTTIDIYTTKPKLVSLPELEHFDEIVFTSPSTVDAFFSLSQKKPRPEQCLAVGPITAKSLSNYLFNI